MPTDAEIRAKQEIEMANNNCSIRLWLPPLSDNDGNAVSLPFTSAAHCTGAGCLFC